MASPPDVVRAARRTRPAGGLVWAAALAVALAACSSDSSSDAPVADEAPAVSDQIETTGAGVEPDGSAAPTTTDTTEPDGTAATPPTTTVAGDDASTPSSDGQDESVVSDDSGDDVTDESVVATTTPGVGTIVDGNIGGGVTEPVGDLPVPVPGPTVASDLDDEVDYGTGVLASITSVEAVEVEARFPGERSGPGVIVSVEVDNQSSDPVALDFVTVDLIRSDGASAIPVELAVPSALSGDLAPGASGVGQYQFFIPADQRVGATITVSYAADVPTALFSGDLPDA